MPARAARWIGPDHVVVGQNVPVAQLFRGLSKVSNSGRIVADFGLGKNDANTHIRLLFDIPNYKQILRNFRCLGGLDFCPIRTHIGA
jgi:hypothetical protein